MAQIITKEKVQEYHLKTPLKRCFSSHTGIQEAKQNGNRSFSVKFRETIQPIFEKETGLILQWSSKFENYWCSINNDKKYQIVKDWERKYGTKVFLRDSLDLSLALDHNFADAKGNYTLLGAHEDKAKNERDPASIAILSDAMADAIRSLLFYRDADCICGVPPSLGKEFDLPTSLAKNISAQTGKKDITSDFKFLKEKKSVKNAKYEEKWLTLEEAQLNFLGDCKGKNVILLDDKYQSGTTLQYVAMKLQQAGAAHVYGLCAVKTLRDDDNT